MASDNAQERIDVALKRYVAAHFGDKVMSAVCGELARTLTDDVGAPVVVFAFDGLLYGYVVPFPTLRASNEEGGDDGK